MRQTQRGPDELPPELEDLYDPEEVFAIDASPEEVASALVSGDSTKHP